MGPLKGVRVLEIGGIGPIKFVGMMLSDMGAEIIRVERMPHPDRPDLDFNDGIVERNRRRIAVDLKSPAGVDLVLRLADQADVLIEAYRPGVMERLGLGPDECLARNQRLIYGRMTGWGQHGPLAKTAGHDINYISAVGVTGAIGSADRRPAPPLNLVGDYGGGAMTLVIGICAALFETARSGKGQVIDAAICDGAALLMNIMYELHQKGEWSDEREANLMDGGSPYYGTYETSDGKFMSVGSAEPQFYHQLLVELGLDSDEELVHGQNDTSLWPAFRERIAAAFKTRTRDEWTARMMHKDVCVVPVLTMGEAMEFPHNTARGVFIKVGDFVQAAPAPRFSRTPSDTPTPPGKVGAETDAILAAAGLSAATIAALKAGGVVI